MAVCGWAGVVGCALHQLLCCIVGEGGNLTVELLQFGWAGMQLAHRLVPCFKFQRNLVSFCGVMWCGHGEWLDRPWSQAHLCRTTRKSAPQRMCFPSLLRSACQDGR